MKPKYISEFCPGCNAKLILNDLRMNPNCPQENIWEDEYWCMTCNDGIHMDWPQSEIDELNRRFQDVHPEKLVPWENVKKKLGVKNET